MGLTIAALVGAFASILGTIVTLIITTVVRHRLESALKASDDTKKKNHEAAVKRQVMVKLARKARENWQKELHQGLERMQKRIGGDDLNGAYHDAYLELCAKDNAITEFDEHEFAELKTGK